MDNEKMRLLTRPFSDIKSRPGRNGQAIQYVEGHAIVQRLNEALAGDWSFKVLEHDVREGEVIVLGELRAGDRVKQAFGGSEVTRTRDGKVVSLADDLKSAATDALKKAATLLGVALQLYGVEEPPVTPSVPRLVPPVQDGDEPDVPPGNRLTRRQAEFIGKLGRANGLSKGEMDERAKAQFGTTAAFLTVRQASEFIQALTNAA